MFPDDDFTDAFCAFLQSSITTVDAAELLLVLYEQPQRAWSTSDLLAASAPGANLTEAEVARYVDVFEQQGLVVREADERVRYRPEPELHAHVQTLSRLYNERPVTLFRVIYALRDSKIKTLADAFRFWRK
ncbi:MAG TPA: hypothetical protein VIN61_08100 [Gammaproteobacteria bacterium]